MLLSSFFEFFDPLFVVFDLVFGVVIDDLSDLDFFFQTRIIIIGLEEVGEDSEAGQRFPAGFLRFLVVGPIFPQHAQQ